MLSATPSSKLSPAVAAQVLLNRRRARRSAVQFAGIIDVPGRPISKDPECELFHPVETNLALHHRLLLEALEETAATPYGRLMVFMPRGSAKSTYASVVFPAYYLGKYPGSRVLLASYGSDLAKRNGRKTRSILRQQRYHRLFEAGLSEDSSAADNFALTNASEYLAFGLEAGVVGTRADGIVIDDPVKGIEAAESAVQREKTWDAYFSDLTPCLIPGGWLVIVMTRWHQEDLAGRILPADWMGESGYFEGRDGMRWRVLCVQAKCETDSDPLKRQPGEYLWPEWFDRQLWVPYEPQVYTWNSMYQQRPRPVEGAFFQEANFLVQGAPVDLPLRVAGIPRPLPFRAVFAIIDTAVKDGLQHDGLAVIYCGLMHGIPYEGTADRARPWLCVLDWDITQMKGAYLEAWLPGVFRRLEQLQAEVPAQQSLGAWIEDKAAGQVLIQQAENHNWPARGIDSKLTSLGKSVRAINCDGYVACGDFKLSRHAYEKRVEYKGLESNHLLRQLLGFKPGSQDKAADDLLDCATYAMALALGNTEGF